MVVVSLALTEAAAPRALLEAGGVHAGWGGIAGVGGGGAGVRILGQEGGAQLLEGRGPLEAPGKKSLKNNPEVNIFQKFLCVVDGHEKTDFSS